MDHKIRVKHKSKSVNVISDDASSKLLIPNREIVGRDGAEDMPSEIDTQSERTPSSAPPVGHNIIVSSSSAADEPTPVLNQTVDDHASEHMDIKPVKKKTLSPSAAVASANKTAPTTSVPLANSVSQDDPADSAPADAIGAKSVPGAQKAIEPSAPDTTKRDHEIQDMIDSRQYFVPIDAVARRRSIKVSIGLTVLVLLLGIILIDFMLDSGTILLLQKIPHTHFFSAIS
jgi:hypothetical protein